MPDNKNRKKYAELQKEIKSLRLRIAELEKDELRHSRIGAPLKSDLLYQTLMENIHLGISFIDTSHKIITTNVGLGRFFRKPQSEIIGKYCFREFEKRSTVCSHCPGTRAMATGRPAEVKTEGVRDDGSHFAVYLRAFPVFEADGTIKGFVEIVEDIAERRQAEEKLKESEQRFKTIFDNAADGILLADVENKKFYIGNKAICQMLGCKPEEIKNLAVSDIHPKEYLSSVIRVFEKQAKREITMAKDIPVKRKDGSVFYADISSFTITFGGKTYLAGIFRDITEHKKAEEALHESKERFRSLAETTSDWIWEVDTNGIYTYVSPKVKDLLGYEPDDVIGKTPFDLMIPNEAKNVSEKFRAIVESRRPFTGLENTNLHKNGRYVVIETSGVPVFDQSGNLLGYRGIDRDITERRKAEEELNTYRERMARTEQLASLGTLSATLAHELTQPLTVIRLSIENSLEDLEAKSCPKSVIEGLKDGLNEVSNATSVIDRFRNFARQSSKKTFCKTNLNLVAGRIIQLLGKTAQRAKITLHIKGIDKLPLVYSNEKDLEQLFFALTENAIQAADGKKSHRLTIEGVVKDKNIELQFSDNCSGIASENLNRIFDPFFTTGADDGRTGLGLPIVQRIVSEYGGRISVHSQLGKGTTFYVTLPIHFEMVK